MLLNAAPSRRLERALDSLWYLASAPQTLAALLALVALTLAFAAVVPQAPVGLDPAAAERWLSSAAARFGSATPVLLSIGAFEILSGPWLALLLAALGLNLALRLAAQLRFLLKRSTSGEAPLPPAGLYPAQAVVNRPIDDLSTRAEQLLRAELGFATVARDGARVQIFAERRSPGLYGMALAYGGGLLLIAGLLLDATFGWRATGVILAQDRPVTLNQASGLRIALDHVEGDDVFSTAALLLSSGGRTQAVSASTTWPGRWGNLLVAERATGPALSVSAQDGSAQPLLVQSLAPGGEVSEALELLFDQTQSEQAFAIPTRDLTFRAVYYPSLPDQGIMRPVYQVEAYRRGEESAPAASVLVEDADKQAQLAVQDVHLLVRSGRYVDIEAAYLPGLLPLLLGGVLVLGGIILSVCWGMTRAWVDLTPIKDGVRAVVRMAAPALPGEQAERLLAHVISAPPLVAPVEAPTGAPVGASTDGLDTQPEQDVV